MSGRCVPGRLCGQPSRQLMLCSQLVPLLSSSLLPTCPPMDGRSGWRGATWHRPRLAGFPPMFVHRVWNVWDEEPGSLGRHGCHLPLISPSWTGFSLIPAWDSAASQPQLLPVLLCLCLSQLWPGRAAGSRGFPEGSGAVLPGCLPWALSTTPRAGSLQPFPTLLFLHRLLCL